MINERLAESGIAELRTTQMKGDDFEVRVWVGFAETGEDGIILRHSSGQWSGLYLHGISRGPRVVATVTNLPAPKSGWEPAWQKLTQAGLLTLPDALAIGEAKQMLEIAGIIAEEFDLSEFKTRG